MKQGWTYKKLGDIASYINGFPFKPSDWVEKGKPIIRIQNLTGSQAKFNRCDRDDIPSKYIVTRGDILISWSATLGVYEWNLEDALLNQHIFKVVFDKIKINKSFFRYAIIMSLAEMARHTNGATMKHIRKGDFDDIAIPIPSLEEQERIVERLDAAFAQIDELKNNAEKQLAEARALFQSALTQAMQPKPNWQEKTLGDIANIIHGKNQKEVVSETGKYPIYGSGGNIMGYATDYLCDAGTTILGRKGSINNPQFINEKFWNVDTAFGISAKEDNDNKFIYYFIRSIDWSKKNTGTTLPSLTQSVVKSVNLFVPNLTDQQAISSYLDSLYAQITEIERVNNRIVAECDALKQALLRQIFE